MSKHRFSAQKSRLRPLRVADQIQKNLSNLIALTLKDPRVEKITLTEVKVTQDYAFADIYFSSLSDDKAAEITQALNHAAVFLRHHLAKTLILHTIPQLRFIYDESMARAAHLSRLIEVANASQALADLPAPAETAAAEQQTCQQADC